MSVQGVIFDAFGTLMKIQNGVHPYRQIYQKARQQGRRPQADDAFILMTKSLGLAEAADYFGIKIAAQELEAIQSALDEELAGVQAFPDAIDAVGALKEAGLRVGICSNLAQPYGGAVRRLFPCMHGYGFSFEIGCAKPSPAIYQTTFELMGVRPIRNESGPTVLMVGDSLRCDQDGPRAVGIGGYLLDRSGKTGFSSLMEFAQFVLASKLG
ncbi:haloacid dehalogenase [Pseudomonas sp. Bc-h]|uniref:HAD family hydrolase n=1 Tax=Pseudomonas sp. Bc-h TaxID=1943632 RepID=UPI0009DA0F9F|nr:HAD family hydrolase [Pseudomonas sp. Bc-h]OQR29683.1 haloacid dehalogenase [Pseudomonas sp. Bc-h]